MTTIAANLKEMSADTRQVGDMIAHVNKMVECQDCIVGVAGDWALCQLFLEWARNDFSPKKKPVMPEGNFDALELCHYGLFQWDRALFRSQILDTRFAIGSGAMAAAGAMAWGATPAQAVETASDFDENTGTETQTIILRKRPTRG